MTLLFVAGQKPSVYFCWLSQGNFCRSLQQTFSGVSRLSIATSFFIKKKKKNLSEILCSLQKYEEFIEEMQKQF